jgi:ribosomal peptide maturation radical SAM protein 1
LEQLSARYGTRAFKTTDNIMPANAPHGYLKALSNRGKPYALFYEVRSDLTAEELSILKSAGVSKIQPGIESFCTDSLKRMKKGVSGISNIRLLRDCRAMDISPRWNILVNIPGETDASYQSMIDLIPCIEHLSAPVMIANVALVRFSPYFNEPDAFGCASVKPFSAYSRVYPDSYDTDKIAYYFQWENLRPCPGRDRLMALLTEKVTDWQQRWRKGSKKPQCQIQEVDALGFMIKDTRTCSPDTYYPASEMEYTLLKKCEKPVKRLTLTDPEKEVFQDLYQKRFIIRHEGRYLSVVIDKCPENNNETVSS